MQRLFLDTNIVLDLLGERKPFYTPIAQLATLADKGEVQLIVSALSFATTFYVLAKFESAAIAKNKIRKFKIITQTADLTDTTIDKGLSSNCADFEDALQYHCALQSNCDIIITRNAKDFKTSDLPIMSANEYLGSIRNK